MGITHVIKRLKCQTSSFKIKKSAQSRKLQHTPGVSLYRYCIWVVKSLHFRFKLNACHSIPYSPVLPYIRIPYLGTAA